MAQIKCPGCRGSSFQKIGRDTELLPTLPGETWEPAIKNYVVYRCNACGRTVRKEIVLGLPLALSDAEWSTYLGVAAALVGLVLLLWSASAQNNAGSLLTVGTLCVAFGILALLAQNRTS
jgi:hypothetical protein